MKLINYLTDNNLDISNSKAKTLGDWNVRIAVRAVLLNNKNKIALMYIAKYDVYKLPGGGIDKGENLNTAFTREMLEETGCEAKRTKNIGITIEKRDKWKLFQVSHCFIASAKKMKNLELTDEEKTSGFSLHWIKSINQALKLVSKNKSKRYDDKYIKARDCSILQKAKELMIKQT